MHDKKSPRKSKFGPVTKFLLTSEQCEVLCILESCNTVASLAVALKKDPSVISRQLQKICETAPVLEKIQGRWSLTAIGHEVVSWSRSSANSLNRIFQRKQALRVGTTREFATRVLCPQIHTFIEDILPGAELVLLTQEIGVEEMLLAGEVDFGIDCGRPRDPMIQFKMVTSEPFSIFASPRLFGKNPPKNLKDLFLYPNLQYRRVSTSRYMKLAAEPPLVTGYFNDPASIREACCAGFGWAAMPEYAVQRELREGKLQRFDFYTIDPDKFGIWWIRGGSVPSSVIEAAKTWLAKQAL